MADTYYSLTTGCILIFVIAGVFYVLLWLRSNAFLRIFPSILMAGGAFLGIAILIIRWVEAQRPPFKSLYESLILLSACICIIYLIAEVIYKIRALGILASAGGTIINIYALTNIDKEIVKLPAALQSVWFIPHVVVYFFGYAALFVAFITAILYLFHPEPLKRGRIDLIGTKVIDLEKFANETMRFGFVLLTAGLLMGAFWAKSAWGDYWVWDPKETWSLISWMIFVIVIHLRFLPEWRGKRFSLLIIIGFSAVMFTYLGMNLLPTAEQSMHVYQ